MTVPNGVDWPCDADLPVRLATALTGQKPGAVEIVLFRSGRESRWILDDAGRPVEPVGSHEVRLSATCTAKLFTTTAILEACARHGIALDAELTAVLPGERSNGFWNGVTLEQLLMHTHGLDDPALPIFPRRADGRIDLNRLLTRIASIPRIAAPDAMFSSTDLGPLLAAAVMEQLLAMRFDTILQRYLPAGFDIAAMSEASSTLSWKEIPDYICPTTGGKLTVTASDLMRLMRCYFEAPGAARSIACVRHRTPPAWTTMGQTVCLGWNGHAGDWFGYNATTLGGGSTLMRFHPQTASAFVIVSKVVPAFAIYHAILKASLPEFAALRPPRSLTAQELHAADLLAYTGRFASGPLTATIEVDAERRLALVIENRHGAPPVLREPMRHHLRLGLDHSFCSMPLNAKVMPYGRFLRDPQRHDSFEYLWNGRYLWRRSA